MKRFHLIFGLIVILVFLLTGQYMHWIHHHLRYMPDGPRMLYRTRHIFILMSGLLHLGIGSYFGYRPSTARRALQIVGSIFITAASVSFTIAFFYEPRLDRNLDSPFSHFGMILIAVGALLHLFSGIGKRDEEV